MGLMGFVKRLMSRKAPSQQVADAHNRRVMQLAKAATAHTKGKDPAAGLGSRFRARLALLAMAVGGVGFRESPKIKRMRTTRGRRSGGSRRYRYGKSMRFKNRVMMLDRGYTAGLVSAPTSTPTTKKLRVRAFGHGKPALLQGDRPWLSARDRKRAASRPYVGPAARAL